MAVAGLVGLIALATSAPTAAAEVAAPVLTSGQPAVPAEAVARALALAQHAAEAVAPSLARIRVTAGALDARLKLAPCTRIDPYLVSGLPTWGRTRVGLRCTEGARWSVYLPVQVQVLAPALVARQALPAGTHLSDDQLETVEVDWAEGSGTAFTDPASLVGRVLAHPVAAGQAPRAGDLQPRQWFASGQQVRVLATGGGFAISTEGQALAPGLEGQLVRVRTESGRVLMGRPTGQGQVEVAL